MLLGSNTEIIFSQEERQLSEEELRATRRSSYIFQSPGALLQRSNTAIQPLHQSGDEHESRQYPFPPLDLGSLARQANEAEASTVHGGTYLADQQRELLSLLAETVRCSLL